MLTSPNVLRPGVVGGFILALMPGLVPTLSIGALFAQGTLYRPGSAPVLAAAPASQFSYLGYNSSTGFYWTTNPAGVTAGDAVLGWVETNGTDLIAVSNQAIATAVAATTTAATGGGTSGVTTVGGGVPGGGASFGGMETMVPDVSWNVTPDVAQGLAHYIETTTNAINVLPPVNASGGTLVVVVVLQGSTGRAVTWNAAYKGISEYVVDQRAQSYASLMFQVQADLSCLLIGVAGNGALRA